MKLHQRCKIYGKQLEDIEIDTLDQFFDRYEGTDIVIHEEENGEYTIIC